MMKKKGFKPIALEHTSKKKYSIMHSQDSPNIMVQPQSMK
jgi:hypothetical protein